ncbi:hypothetical protein E2P65_04030 [Candidatus Bathyarchaeota archaeon]|nr:hypothetical protein E2P65_04030 [Candidatus Bathyarchaeota archaeon]
MTLIFACAFALQVPTIQGIDRPLVQVSTDQIYVTAGQENTIKITLRNTGDIEVADIRGSLSSSTPGISVLSNSHVAYGLIMDDSSVTFSSRLYIDEEIPLGAYSLTFQLSYYKYTVSPTTFESHVIQIGIVVTEAVRTHQRLEVEVIDTSLVAGARNLISISLENQGEGPFYFIEVSIASSSPYIAILDGARYNHTSLDVWESALHTPLLQVSISAPLGVYTLTETVTYEDENGESYFDSFTLGFSVDYIAQTDVKVDVTVEDPRLVAGEENAVTVSLANIGSEPVYLVDAKLLSTSPYFTVLENARHTADGLEPGGSSSFVSNIAVSGTAPVGVYSMSATVGYTDSYGRSYMESFTIGMRVESVQVAEQTSVVMMGYSTDPEIPKPGDAVTMTVVLSCTGANAYDVRSTLRFDPMTGISSLGPSLVASGGMEPGETASAPYHLLLDGGLRAGQYPASLTVSYLDSDGLPRSLVESVTLSVRGIVEFTLINDEEVSVSSGEVSNLEADLLLIGTESIQFVKIEVVENEVFYRVSGSSEYIGAVDPDSPVPFDLNFGVDDGVEPGEYPLRLRVTYKDDLNQDNEDTVELPVHVVEPSSQPQSSQGSGGGFWGWLRRLLGLG